MKKCELCNSVAKMYCESDQAILCWDCDSRVHSANFLVAKHLRTLLCHLCQSPTRWNGSGPKLGPTVSVCENCVNRNACRSEEINNEEIRDEDDEEDDDDLDGEDDSSDDGGDSGGDSGGDEENQVVPWSTPPVSSSSTSEDQCRRPTRFDTTQEGSSQSRTSVLSLKRMRDTKDSSSRDHHHTGCSFSPKHQTKNFPNESTSLYAQKATLN